MSRQGWQGAAVSACGTYHVRDGQPLYAKRFVRVLPFHAPGLAPVRNGGKSWHITPDGEAAYACVFQDVAGFYENLAAVDGGHGWFHIRPNGAPAYAARHTWSGNFQGGRCTVCDARRYYHIRPDGCPAYSATYAYAGDFREGCAVIKDNDGLCRHITVDGAPAHPCSYRNLDVYHKGHACAQDESGWMHVDRSGMPVYQGRYASVEPFYNGRALTRTFDGKTVTIDERGALISVISAATCATSEKNPGEQYRLFHELSRDMVGYWKTFAIAAAVKLNVPEKLPISDAQLASRFGETAANMPLLLRALEEMQITESIGGVWRLTPKGALLAKGDFSLADAALVWEEFASGNADTWVNALAGRHGTDFFAGISPNMPKVKRLHDMLATYAKNDYALLAEILPLDDAKHLVDAGGGDGTVARMIARKWQKLHITVFDRPDVLTFLDEQKNSPGRITKLAGDIFSRWRTTADAVLLARVLHDWNDQKAARILKNANLALPLGGKLFIVETICGTPAAMASVHLLTIGGGRERTLREYQYLMAENGFSLVEHRYLNPSASLLAAEKTQ